MWLHKGALPGRDLGPLPHSHLPLPRTGPPPMARWATGSPASGETLRELAWTAFPSPHLPRPCCSFPRGERIICFSCCPDLWPTLFFIYLHKLSKVTSSFPEVRDSVNTSGSQVSRPARGGRGYRRSPGNGR